MERESGWRHELDEEQEAGHAEWYDLLAAPCQDPVLTRN